jgi:hypothetical protein
LEVDLLLYGDWMKTAGRIIGACVIVIVLVVAGYFAASTTTVYVRGDHVTAHVDRCTTKTTYGRTGSRTTTTCTGTWIRANGQPASGEILATDLGDEGRDIAVRAGADRAIADRIGSLLPLGVFVALVAAVTAIGAYEIVRSRRRRRRSEPTYLT